MDAAQMLTAQEIARQCERLAGIAQQREGGSQDRHLHAVDPITQPIERVPAAEECPPHGELTAREWGVLAFERQWWKASGAKERAVRELFDMSPSHYSRLLDALVDKPAAVRADPMLIKRLSRVRENRQDARSARQRGSEHS